eukprot:4345967-Pyramimonas_sp.AAC.1
MLSSLLRLVKDIGDGFAGDNNFASSARSSCCRAPIGSASCVYERFTDVRVIRCRRKGTGSPPRPSGGPPPPSRAAAWPPSGPPPGWRTATPLCCACSPACLPPTTPAPNPIQCVTRR